MQVWYWDYPKTIDGFNWANTLTNKAQELADTDFINIWFPPLSRASFGNRSGGYDPQDLFDLGKFNLVSTGFETRTDVNELIAEFNNVGLNAVADIVYNHRDGGESDRKLYLSGTVYLTLRPCKIYSTNRRKYRKTGTYYFKIKSKIEHPDFLIKLIVLEKTKY